MMALRSSSSSAMEAVGRTGSGGRGGLLCSDGTGMARWAAVTRVPSQVMSARSMAFCSSRMFPGHVCRRQYLAGVPTQRHIALAHLGREAAEERVGEEEHIVASFPQ